MSETVIAILFCTVVVVLIFYAAFEIKDHHHTSRGDYRPTSLESRKKRRRIK
jgi:hypothetical protein